MVPVGMLIESVRSMWRQCHGDSTKDDVCISVLEISSFSVYCIIMARVKERFSLYHERHRYIPGCWLSRLSRANNNFRLIEPQSVQTRFRTRAEHSVLSVFRIEGSIVKFVPEGGIVSRARQVYRGRLYEVLEKRMKTQPVGEEGNVRKR